MVWEGRCQVGWAEEVPKIKSSPWIVLLFFFCDKCVISAGKLYNEALFSLVAVLIPPTSSTIAGLAETPRSVFLLFLNDLSGPVHTYAFFLPLFPETHYSPFNMASYGTLSHLWVFFQPLHFWKGSGTFLNEKQCIFDSIDFNGETAEKHVARLTHFAFFF